MGAICLTLAPILRCVSLTRLQSALLLIPPGLEVYFCLALIISKWHSSSLKHLLLAAEGLIYFAWSLLDFLTHFVPAARSSLQVFKSLDIVLGSLSSIPLFLYTLFLFLVSRSELLQNFPPRLRTVANYIFGLLIPTILLTNALGSFLGISYRTLLSPGLNLPPYLAVGFLDAKAQFLWMFFSSLTLALLALYQALIFLLIFSRMVIVLQDKRRLEGTENTLQIHRLRGVPYITFGMVLCMIETLVGFCQGGFGVMVARKILRFFARAIFIVGLIKGWDSLEDFSLLPRDMGRHPKRRSLLNLISQPRYSTFQHVDGGAENNVTRNLRTLSFPTSSNAVTYNVPRSGSRVTVLFPRGRAPTLHLRMSDIAINPYFNEAPKTAPARLDDDLSPLSPASAGPLLNLPPLRKGSSMMTITRDVLAKARARYHRYSTGSVFFDPRDSVVSNVDYDGGPGGRSTSNTPPRRWSRANSPSGLWLSRSVNRLRHSSGLNVGHRSSLGDPGSVVAPPDPTESVEKAETTPLSGSGLDYIRVAL